LEDCQMIYSNPSRQAVISLIVAKIQCLAHTSNAFFLEIMSVIKTNANTCPEYSDTWRSMCL